jgi:hypothetical protein
MSHKLNCEHNRKPRDSALDIELIEEKIAELNDDELTPSQAERLQEIILQIEAGRGESVTLH